MVATPSIRQASSTANFLKSKSRSMRATRSQFLRVVIGLPSLDLDVAETAHARYQHEIGNESGAAMTHAHQTSRRAVLLTIAAMALTTPAFAAGKTILVFGDSL